MSPAAKSEEKRMFSQANGMEACTQTEPNLFAVADPGVGPGGQAPPPLLLD